MSKLTRKAKGKSDRLKRISLYPLMPKQALSASMRVDPAKVKAAERRAQKKSRALSK